jgi:hypothetical protein
MTKTAAICCLVRAFDRELKTNGMVIDSNKAWNTGTVIGMSTKACKEREEADMSENGKVNWKSGGGVLLQELWRPRGPRRVLGNRPTCTSLIRWFVPANDGESCTA